MHFPPLKWNSSLIAGALCFVLPFPLKYSTKVMLIIWGISHILSNWNHWLNCCDILKSSSSFFPLGRKDHNKTLVKRKEAKEESHPRTNKNRILKILSYKVLITIKQTSSCWYLQFAVLGTVNCLSAQTLVALLFPYVKCWDPIVGPLITRLSSCTWPVKKSCLKYI